MRRCETRGFIPGLGGWTSGWNNPHSGAMASCVGVSGTRFCIGIFSRRCDSSDMRTAHLMLVSSLPGALLVSMAACGSKSGQGFDDGNHGSGDDGGLVNEGGLGKGSKGSDAGTCGTCSSDLHTAYDCSGSATVCPPAQGCAAGKCVAACDAASASHTSIGCDYWTLAPDIIDDDNLRGSCFAAFVANTWGSPVTISGEYAGSTIDISSAARLPTGSGASITYAPLPGGQIPANEVAIVFLAATATAAVKCPAGVTPAIVADPALHATGVASAFHIAASEPVVAYQEFPYGGGSSAVTGSTLLLPASVWTTNYVGVDAYAADPYASWLAIVADQDNTEVTLTPTAAIAASGAVPAIASGVTGSFTLNRGQFAELSTTTGSLAGTPIQSSAPVAVFGGNACMNVPSGSGACDGAHQQIPPVAALGHEYVGVKYRDRFSGVPETPPWRVVGAVDGTTLTWKPSTPAGAPTAIGKGEVLQFAASGPFVVSSQDANHPFYFAQYMGGWQSVTAATSSDSRGDPEVVGVVPAQQYLSSYVFFTDPTYPETNLVVVRAKGASGFADVTLDCAGVIGGWTAVDPTDTYEFTRVDLSTGNFVASGSCNNGRHTMTSTSAFGLTIWGWGSAATGGSPNCVGSSCGGFYSQAVSYAYPAGMSVAPINTVVVPPAPR